MDYSDIQCIEESINGLKCRLLLKKEGNHPLIMVGLNPSKADEFTPDATMRKIMGFINIWNADQKCSYDGFLMLNLYPLRETIPAELKKHKFKLYENLHSRNLEVISSILDEYPKTDILLCYGDSIEKVPWLKFYRDEILKLLARYPQNKLLSLGNLTNKGNPRHPCRLSYKTEREIFKNPFANK